jgi:hypothetical protein
LVARHEEFDRMSKLDSFRYGVAIYSSWETVRYYDCAFVADASQKLARAGIACERYRLKHGSWPEGLEALVPEYLSDVPIDVFAGSRFSYEVEGDRLSLESAQHAIRYAGTYQGASPLKFVLEKPSQR